MMVEPLFVWLCEETCNVSVVCKKVSYKSLQKKMVEPLFCVKIRFPWCENQLALCNWAGLRKTTLANSSRKPLNYSFLKPTISNLKQTSLLNSGDNNMIVNGCCSTISCKTIEYSMWMLCDTILCKRCFGSKLFDTVMWMRTLCCLLTQFSVRGTMSVKQLHHMFDPCMLHTFFLNE